MANQVQGKSVTNTKASDTASKPGKKMYYVWLVVGLVVIAIIAQIFSSSFSSLWSQNQNIQGIPLPSNHSCPCLTKQQIGQVINASAAEVGQASFNITYIANVTSQVLSAQQSHLPANISDTISTMWIVSYNSSQQNSNTTAVVEIIFKNSNAEGQFDYLRSIYMDNASWAPYVKTGSINGFTFMYYNASIASGKLPVFDLTGYKDGYLIDLLVAEPNRLSPVGIIANVVASTV